MEALIPQIVPPDAVWKRPDWPPEIDALGLTVVEHPIRPGIRLAFLDGQPEEGGEVPLGTRERWVDIFFFLAGRTALEADQSVGRAISFADAPHGGLTGSVLFGASRNDRVRLRLEPGEQTSIILIRLLPQVADWLSKPDREYPFSAFHSDWSVPDEEQFFAPRFSLLSCPAAMKACLRKLHQSRRSEGWRKVSQESLVLHLLYQLAGINGLGKNRSKHISEEDQERLQAARRILDVDLSAPPGVAELAACCGLNQYKLKRGFKALFANTIYGYVAEQRMEKARDILAEGRLNVDEAGRAVGYSNVSHFIAAFRRQFGINPGCYKRDVMERLYCAATSFRQSPAKEEGPRRGAVKTAA
jgi:AraC-like DNA-binding protein